MPAVPTFAVLAFVVFIAILLFAMLVIAGMRMVSASRKLADAERNTDTAFMAAAMGDAVKKLREQERALAARAEASERLSDQIIDNLPSGLLVVDKTGVPKRINPAGARLLGLSATPDIRSTWSALGESSGPMRALIAECLSTGAAALRRTLVLEPPAGDPTAARRHLGAGVSPLRDAKGDVTGAICLFTDLTSVVDLEEQLRLKDSLARLGELTAGLAHEFRNGLATIHGYARLMQPDKVPADHRAYIDSMRRETESLTEIVANFLAFARPSHDTLVPIELAPVVTRAVDEVSAEARAHGGSIGIEGEFGRIEGDDVLLRQVAANLLRNAVEACVEAGRVPSVRVRGTLDAAANQQRVTIADNGPGVPEHLRDKIFRPFFTTRGRGTGLGLALAQKIIVSHNGRIAIGSSPEGGAEFAIVLPLAPRRN